jgi:DNA helicase HerA-like ATPase
LQHFPTTLWDVFGEQGHPVRATVSDLGPLLLARMLNLNETQAGVLQLVFKIADDDGLLLLDMKDLRAMCQLWATTPADFTTEYGNVSAASIGAIQRGLMQIEQQGRRPVFWRAHAQHCRFHADRQQRARHDQCAGGRQADEFTAPVRHLFAVDAERTV